MNAPDKIFLPDVQSHEDVRNIVIQKVGVKSIRHPLTIAGDHDQPAQGTVAMIDMYVRLPGDVKGTHMSRFLEVLQAHDEPLDVAGLRTLMTAMLQRLEADAGYIRINFPYFLRKTAPVSGVESLLDYDVTLTAEVRNGVLDIQQQVVVPVTSLCPCSKKISNYGAHNQRSHVTINATVDPEADKHGDPLPLQALIRIAETSASCELWGLLKRPDEKYVTERAYENPKFVEDMVRDVAMALNAEPRVLAYTISSENFESIHNHSAYAVIEHDKRVS